MYSKANIAATTLFSSSSFVGFGNPLARKHFRNVASIVTSEISLASPLHSVPIRGVFGFMWDSSMQMANVASNQGEFTMWINYGSLVVALFAVKCWSGHCSGIKKNTLHMNGTLSDNLYAINALTGSEIWSFTTGYSVVFHGRCFVAAFC